MDLKDWNPKEMRDILTAIEFNYVYNGKESPFGKRDMDVLMKFFTKAEELKRSIESQTPALFKAKDGEGFADKVVGWFAP